MKKNIVYYHPRAIKKQPDRGSDLRVAKMLEAFRQLNYEVIVIAGDSRERHKKIKELKSQVRSGLKIEYVYGESTNAPIIFADKRLIPSNFLKDYAFFTWLRKQQIPFGIFYRDVYWRFDFFKRQIAWPFNILFKPLYYLDWYMYDRYCTLLFLPSDTMNQHLPKPRARKRFRALPPGYSSSVTPHQEYDTAREDSLKLLYVGAIEPSVYDISLLLKTVKARDDLELVICCTKSEWDSHRKFYEPYMTANMELAHVNSEQLAKFYLESDLFMIITSHSSYRDFAMPVKLFEAIGYSVPIVSMNQVEVANYVQSSNIGWVLDNCEELDELLTFLSANRSMLAEKHRNLLIHRKLCSWESRAESADDYLTNAL